MAPSDSPYVELHCHSAYSFLDGVSLPEELAQRAGELGYTALALTDHNSVSGSMELAQVAADHGVRAIHGAEIDLAAEPAAAGGGRHLTLLVRDGRGWSNLCRILTLAHAHTREGSRRRELGEPAVSLQAVLDHAEGLVCLTGCAERSAIASGVRDGRGATDEPVARRLLEAFGPEGMYVELQRPYARHDRARNRALAALARRLALRCVATGDIHAHIRARAELQDAFVALRHRTTLDASEPLRRGNHSHVMSTPQAMASRFGDHPEAVRETLLLAEQLTFDLTKDLGYRYPGAEDESSSRRLAELCASRLEDRYGPGAPPEARADHEEARARLEQELHVIDRLGLAGFFLLHHDMLELAREVALEVRGPDSVRALLAPGRGRGSSVSSLVCYLTGLSHIDPVSNKLALGRFLHEDLHGLPDIDLDFPRDIREKLIPRVHERYGHDRAALVAAFPTFRARGAIRELGKVLGLPAGGIERLARGADRYGSDSEHDVAAALAGDRPGASVAGSGARAPSERWRWLGKLVEQAYGLPRHLSQHSGGMIVSTRPLIDCCPVVPAAMEGRQMVQWDKDSCADAGFLKIDLLGLGMLSAVERCVEEIARVHGERIDLSRIPFDDPRTFRAIRAAETVGVFQIESRAQMQSLLRTRPENLEDVTIQVAIVRPGPIQGGAINPYIERRTRLREDPGYEIPYDHPTLEPVLKETLGTIIFQDQVMEVAEAFAGFTPGEADGLRRAMSRKRSQEMLGRHRERFIAGAQRHVGAGQETAQRVWGMVEGFAGFGFPKAHSAAFGLLAYQSTWLRVHHGAEFLCALLNEQPMGFYAPDSLVHEAENRGIAMLGLDVNASAAQCTVEGGGVRLGLGYVKGVASAEVQRLVAERERGGPFRSLGDLAARAGVTRGTLEQLAWAGSCDSLMAGSARLAGSDTQMGADRRTALWQMGLATPAETPSPGESTQLALPLELPTAPSLRALGRWQRLIADYSTSGVTIGDHALAILRERLTVPRGAGQVGLVTSAQLARLPTGYEVAVAGLVIARQRPGTANGTMFLLFEDEFGTVNLIVSKAVYERHRQLARAEPLLLARGRLERSLRAAGPSALHAGARREQVRQDETAEEIRPVINLIVRELAPLERFLPGGIEDAPAAAGAARVHRLPGSERGAQPGDAAAAAAEEDLQSTEVGSSMRAVAPPVQSFAAGRRR
ncbi:MAG: error-prone polymerase [Solirubrobacteraceae bacterium]|jgi:error-prone DNA polymerase|nr:error-prone polymerase [Solirubrobacteraceae bacterium]